MNEHVNPLGDDFNPLAHKRGGFFDLPKQKICRHPEHNPPGHICIPPGKGYRHVCPACGATFDLIPPQITY